MQFNDIAPVIFIRNTFQDVMDMQALGILSDDLKVVAIFPRFVQNNKIRELLLAWCEPKRKRARRMLKMVVQ